MMSRRTRRQTTHRWIGLGGLLLAAVVLALGWGQSEGQAARSAQNSPLDSPLATRSVLPTPTPTPTSPLPPTLTPPPGLEAWPTPTPTPYPAPVEAAAAFLAEKADREPGPMELVLQQTAPRAGADITVVEFRQTETGDLFWIGVDRRRRAAFLPDYREEAIAFAAAQRNVAEEDIEFVSASYIPYPFTGQIAWSGRLIDTTTEERFNVNFDLDGEPMDLTGVLKEENAAAESYCGVMEGQLCRQLLMAEDEERRWVQIVAVDEEAAGTIAATLDEAGESFERQGLNFLIEAPKSLLLELAPLEDEVSFIFAFQPSMVRPLDTNLILGFVEDEGGLALELESQKHYSQLNYTVEASLTQVEVTSTQQITLDVVVDGVLMPVFGPAAEGPARARLELGDGLSGSYSLVLRYANADQSLDRVDRYSLLIRAGRIIVRPRANRFTWPRYTTWLRLPADAIWFVVQSREVDAQGVPFDVDRETFTAKADDFYAALEDLGAEPLDLAEGVYTARLFIPPWEPWQAPAGDFVEVPVSPEQAYLFKWPDIRYFRFDGDRADVQKALETFCVDEVWITGYTADGVVWDQCQP